MTVGLALLVSADLVAIQQFSHALQELSISPDVCREIPAAIGLLNRRKFDAVIVDLQLGGQSGMILDEVHLSTSNRTAVTFGIGDNDAAGTAAFRKKSQFVFERPLSAQSIHKTLRPAYSLILRERRRYFRYPVSIPVIIQRESKREVRCNSVNISGGGMALSTPGSAGSRRKCPRPVHSAGSRSTSVGGIDDLLVENWPSRSSLRVRGRRPQVRATGLALTKARRGTSGIGCESIPEVGIKTRCNTQRG